MLTLSLGFPAGRYHATPWGRHVNEGDLLWPPEPWRILRALIAVWHRKLDPSRYPEALLEGVIHKLAGELPVYEVPPVIHSHTRHYMPARAGKSTLVYDAFLRLKDGERIRVGWPAVELEESEAALLEELAACMGYLGRAESWVEGEVERDGDWTPNCTPLADGEGAALGRGGDLVSLLCARSVGDYGEWRESYLKALDAKLAKSRKGRQLSSTLPSRLIDALRVETSSLRGVGWSRHPASVDVRYVRPADTVQPFARRRRVRARVPRVTTARLALSGRPLPRIEDAVRVGECFRRALMGCAKSELGEDRIPSCFSGHGVPDERPHAHAFYIPEPDKSGRVGHLILHAPMGLDPESQRVLGALRVVKGFADQEWRVFLENASTASAISGCTELLGPATEWVSVTPYLHPWYAKRRFTVEDQIRRECERLGLPALRRVKWMRYIHVHGRPRRPIHFHRFRTRRGLTQPDTRGSFWSLSFEEPIQGPLALGFACHFGLGLFARKG